MAIGIVLGNTVEAVGPALQKGEFVGVSIPIGTFFPSFTISTCGFLCLRGSMYGSFLCPCVWEG